MPRILSPAALAPDETKDRSWMYIAAQSRYVDQTLPVDDKTVGYLFELNRLSRENYRLTGVNGDTVETDLGTFEYETTARPPFEGWRLVKRPDKPVQSLKAREVARRWTYLRARDRNCKGTAPASATVGYLFEHVLNDARTSVIHSFRIFGRIGDRISTDVGAFKYVISTDPPFIGWLEVGPAPMRRSPGPYVATGAQSSPRTPRTSRSPVRAPSCVRQTTAKYTSPTRRSPPFPANACCGERMRGNDGRWYESKPNVRSICTWRADTSS